MPIQTIDDFRNYVLRNLVVEPDELPVGRAVAWFANPETNIPTMFEVDRPVPFDPFSGVLAVFQSEHTFRIYTIPLPAPSPRPAEWLDRKPARFTLSRIAPTYAVETMTWDVLAQQVVRDGNAAARGELDRILDFIDSKPGDTVNKEELISELLDGDHLNEPELEDEDDDQGGDTTSPGMPAIDGKAPPPAVAAKQ